MGVACARVSFFWKRPFDTAILHVDPTLGGGGGANRQIAVDVDKAGDA